MARPSTGRNFTQERLNQRIDELLDLAQRDPRAAKAEARLLISWLTSVGAKGPEIEDALESLRVLLQLLDD